MGEWTSAKGDGIDLRQHPNKDFVGKYKESFAYDGNFGKKNYIYKFVDKDGLPFSIFGFTTLDRYMSNIEPETWCKITYTGKVKNKRGQDVHTCTVFIKKGELEKAEVTNNDDLPF